jgi:hypothetical protein
MSHSVLAIALALGMGASAHAQHNEHADHQHNPPQQPADAHIVVTINPEARVSAVIGARLPSPPACGSPTPIKVKVINQGFVTAPLRAAITGDGDQQVVLITDDAKLSGAPEDERLLQLVMQGPMPVDATIAFSIDDTVGDLAGRDRVHLLVRCVRQKSQRERPVG